MPEKKEVKMQEKIYVKVANLIHRNKDYVILMNDAIGTLERYCSLTDRIDKHIVLKMGEAVDGLNKFVNDLLRLCEK